MSSIMMFDSEIELTGSDANIDNLNFEDWKLYSSHRRAFFQSNCTITKGQAFLTQTNFRDRLKDWSIDARFSFYVKLHNTLRIVITCRTETCPFYIRLTRCTDVRKSYHNLHVTGGRKFNAVHSCEFNESQWYIRNPANSQRWLLRRSNEILSIDRYTTPSSIQKKLSEAWTVPITYKVSVLLGL